MSDARALQATERCRDLVATPERHGLRRRDGLEPLDVRCIYEHKQRKTTGAFRIIVTMKLSLDGSGVPPFTDATALVAEGHSETRALEQFYNWMADEHAVSRFVESVKAHQAHELDVLAQAEVARAKALTDKQARSAEAYQQNWAERKLDQIARKMGIKDKKVQV
jgi:hypothetical protein